MLKKYNISPETIHCPEKKLRGKPYPDQIFDCIKKNKKKKKILILWVIPTSITWLQKKQIFNLFLHNMVMVLVKKFFKKKYLNLKMLLNI